MSARWKYVTDAASSGFSYNTPQEAFDAAVASGDWWRGAEKGGGTISIRCSDGASFLDAYELEAMMRALKVKEQRRGRTNVMRR